MAYQIGSGKKGGMSFRSIHEGQVGRMSHHSGAGRVTGGCFK